MPGSEAYLDEVTSFRNLANVCAVFQAFRSKLALSFGSKMNNLDPSSGGSLGTVFCLHR